MPPFSRYQVSYDIEKKISKRCTCVFSNDFNKQDYKHKLLSLITYDKNVEAKKQELLPTFFLLNRNYIAQNKERETKTTDK